jgi:hypothetical protein
MSFKIISHMITIKKITLYILILIIIISSLGCKSEKIKTSQNIIGAAIYGTNINDNIVPIIKDEEKIIYSSVSNKKTNWIELKKGEYELYYTYLGTSFFRITLIDEEEKKELLSYSINAGEKMIDFNIEKDGKYYFFIEADGSEWEVRIKLS